MEEVKKKGRPKKQEVAVIQPEIRPVSLFGTDDYTRIVEKASNVAKAVSDIIEKQKLFTIIKGKKYVWCEGWTTMGALLGLFPQIIEVKEERIDRGVKYVSDCEVRNIKGDLVSRAQSECASWEYSKKGNEEYALRSMSETRAVSKAFRIALSWVMVLAGYQPTPAEEMTFEKENTAEPQKATSTVKIPDLALKPAGTGWCHPAEPNKDTENQEKLQENAQDKEKTKEKGLKPDENDAIEPDSEYITRKEGELLKDLMKTNKIPPKVLNAEIRTVYNLGAEIELKMSMIMQKDLAHFLKLCEGKLIG